ncbi:hypothetical protein HOP50_02g16680 [Chloropicon primus]|uniref:Uncharacterized protein n=1 Tax=Chloropicon primus TaxID=1764295 RepID=A0A5B8MG27_9CHLO|nr:hypothetical protein A3770_02p16720 [Chloropicon primus]UPQ98362.1 hypothetical protein HOP50_02g16680 [Chloropicon primus]|eukprot:QDZ19154.1 hypothetical protein A3770_02p16720 [Chloropicon primus]
MGRETGGGEAGDVESQVDFLQNLVFRLSQEVSRNAPSDSALKDEARRVLDGLPEDLEVPNWLVSVDILSPLLRTFESYTSELQRTIDDGKVKFQNLEGQAKAVVAENASLREEVVTLTEKVYSKLQEQGTIKSTSFPDNVDSRLKLLEQENDLLRAQNGELNKEITTLHATLDEKEEALFTLQDQRATNSDNVESLQRENNSVKAKLIDSKSQVDDLKRRLSILEQAKAGTAGGEGVDGASGIKVTQERADRAKLELSNLREENAQLSEELGNQRAAFQATEVEATDLRKQIVSLTDLTAKLELRNSEIQAKELDSINLIQTLNEKLKQEQARNGLLKQSKSELEREVKELHQKTRGHANGLKLSLKEIYQTRVSVAESSARQMENLVSGLKKDVAYAKAQHERSQRDADFYKAQASEMKDLNRGYPTKVEEYLKRIERLEEERDAAKHDSASTSNMVKRIKSDHERLVNSLSMEKERAEKLSKLSTAEGKKLQEELLQMHALVKESEKNLADAQKAESDVRSVMAQKIEIQRAESDEQIKFLKKRLDDELETRKESVATTFGGGEGDASFRFSKREAEDAKMRYESMERQMRAESLTLSRKLEASAHDNSKLREENSQIMKHLNILTQQNREASGCIADAESELIALRERLKASVSKEAQLIQEKEVLYSNLENAKLEMAKTHRAQNSSMKKVDFLRSQCETLQHALASSRMMPHRGGDIATT